MICQQRQLGGLLEEQERAAREVEADARLLAGPGTGKTMTLVEHVATLLGAGVPASGILCLTFTRAAAAGLRRKIRDAIGGAEPPGVFTLHGFALGQLMRKHVDVGSGRGRLRVADDWEERHVVEEDLKRLLEVPDVRDVRRRLRALASAWETTPDAPPEDDPALLGALRRHKDRYRYVLRSELVFLLKAELDADPFFLENSFSHVVVDEYQDLNKCDVAVIDEMWHRGSRLYVAGDDDQSIYQQLRNAHPQAIRDFVDNHVGAVDLRLTTCVRCDSDIIALATRVIEQETQRTPKQLEPHPSAGSGTVVMLAFRNGDEEARGIALLAKAFADAGVPYQEIMVLLRSDYRGTFSELIDAEMRRLYVPARVRSGEDSTLDTPAGRLLLGHLRLIVDREDDLAWRAIVEMPGSGAGVGSVAQLDALADSRGLSFAGALRQVVGNRALLPSTGHRVQSLAGSVARLLDDVEAVSPVDVESWINESCVRLPVSESLEAARQELVGLAATYASGSLQELLAAIALRKEEEQDVIAGNVNIMTMHKAKGLDACVVIVAAAEEAIIPGRGNTDEERRLFYVSLTRARHALFVTHAVNRTGRQAFAGDGGMNHTRTTFLTGSAPSARGLQFARDYMVDPASLTALPADAAPGDVPA